MGLTLLLKRYLHYTVSAGRGRIDCGGDSIEMQPDERPLRVAENHQSDLSG
jgi:hypothetical protein